nr:hypothetical protein [Tanacetum cinerariifolium]
FEDVEYVEASLPDPEIERLINLVENDILDDSTNDPLLEEADLFLAPDHSIPPGIKNFYDSEGDIRFLEALLIDDSILSHESSDSNFEDNMLIPRPPPEPPNTETDAGEEILVVMNDKDEDVYSSFIFVIFAKMFSLLFAESEDTIFDPNTPMVKKNKLDEDLQGIPVDATLTAKPNEKHLHMVKRIFRYLKRTINMGLCWSSKKQKNTAILSTKAEYIALSGCCAQILWIRSQLTDCGFTFRESGEWNSRTILFSNGISIGWHLHQTPTMRKIHFLIEMLGMISMSLEMLKRLTEEEDDLKKARKFKKVASPSKKLSPVLEEEPAKKPMQAKKPGKKSTNMPTVGVVIKDTPSVSILKKKALAKVDRGKGMDLLFDVALLEATQLKKALKKSKQETHKLYAIGSGDGVSSQPKVPNESQDMTSGDSEDDDSNNDDSNDVTNNDDDDVDSDADGNNEASDSERTDFDEDESPNLNENDDEEEEYEEEYDVNVRLKDVEHEKERKGDAEMTDAGRDDVSQEKSYDQFLNLNNVPPVDNEVISMMNAKVRHEEPSTQTPSFLTIPVTKAQGEKKRYIDLIEKSVKDIIKDEVKSQLSHILPKEVSDYTTPILLDKMHKSKSYRGAQEHKELYDGLVKYYKLDKDLFESYGKAYSLKRDLEDKDNDEDPPAGSDQGLKRRKTSKDVEPSKGSKSKESKSSSSKGTKSKPNHLAALERDWFKKPKRPPPPDFD